jgi:hypothetical protein
MEKNIHFEELIKQFNASDEKVFDVIWEISLDPDEAKEKVSELNLVLKTNCQLYFDLYKLDPVYFEEYVFNSGAMCLFLTFLKRKQFQSSKKIFAVGSFDELLVKHELVEKGLAKAPDEKFLEGVNEYMYKTCFEVWVLLLFKRLPKARISEMAEFKEAKNKFSGLDQEIWVSDWMTGLVLIGAHNLLTVFLWPYPSGLKNLPSTDSLDIVAYLDKMLVQTRPEDRASREDFHCEAGLLLKYEYSTTEWGHPILELKGSYLPYK